MSWCTILFTSESKQICFWYSCPTVNKFDSGLFCVCYFVCLDFIFSFDRFSASLRITRHWIVLIIWLCSCHICLFGFVTRWDVLILVVYPWIACVHRNMSLSRLDSETTIVAKPTSGRNLALFFSWVSSISMILIICWF